MGEFDLITRYFTRPAKRAVLGVGDDCALWQVQPGMQLAVSSDMLVEGRHFLSTVPPKRLGNKALAVNLSDLAASGAKPLAFTLALALPRVDETWLQGFSAGLLALADQHDCELVGGDTTHGPLNICITVMGEVPPGDALLRQGAQVGDDIYISCSVGDARMALEVMRGQLSLTAADFDSCRLRMEQPEPRVALGLALRGVANACIDVSDGLAGDLGHVLKASQVGAVLTTDWLQDSAAISSAMNRCPLQNAWTWLWQAATITNSCSPPPPNKPMRCNMQPTRPTSVSLALAASPRAAGCKCSTCKGCTSRVGLPRLTILCIER